MESPIEYEIRDGAMLLLAGVVSDMPWIYEEFRNLSCHNKEILSSTTVPSHDSLVQSPTQALLVERIFTLLLQDLLDGAAVN